MTVPHDQPEERAIELAIEVPGTPDEVWRAIATGPGISSWFVPHTIEEREGGDTSASFGPGPEMEAPGRVAAWEPPHRFVMDGGEGVDGLAFEWLVEACDGGTCIVRLVNTGFGSGDDWDDQYDGMTEGWAMFLVNLRMHLERFGGQSASSMLPAALWAGPRDTAWAELTRALGIPTAPTVGERIEVGHPDAPPLGGTVTDVTPWRICLLTDEPASGTALIAAEGRGDAIGVSVWTYLSGPGGEAAIRRDEPRWWDWLGSKGFAAD